MASKTDDQAAVEAFEAFEDPSQKQQQGCRDMTQGYVSDRNMKRKNMNDQVVLGSYYRHVLEGIKAD